MDILPAIIMNEFHSLSGRHLFLAAAVFVWSIGRAMRATARAAAPGNPTPPAVAPPVAATGAKGGAVTAFASADGQAWQKVGSASVALAGEGYAGLAVCSHNEGRLNKAVFDHVTIEAGAR